MDLGTPCHNIQFCSDARRRFFSKRRRLVKIIGGGGVRRREVTGFVWDNLKLILRHFSGIIVEAIIGIMGIMVEAI